MTRSLPRRLETRETRGRSVRVHLTVRVDAPMGGCSVNVRRVMKCGRVAGQRDHERME